MNNHQLMKHFISSFSGQQNVLTIPRPYLEITDDVTAALVLNQMIYYSSITKRKDGFFYKSYKEWEEETTLTQFQIKRITDKLKKMGFVETKLKKASGSPTIHYKVSIESIQTSIVNKLNNELSINLIMDNEETPQSLTENSTENSTENKDLSSKIKDLLSHFSSINNFVKLNKDYWDVIRETRKHGKIAESVIYNNMNKWTRYDNSVVEHALRTHIKTCKGRREEYTLGIMRNTSKEEINKRGGLNKGRTRKVARFDVE